jgi:hypothetical protein
MIAPVFLLAAGIGSVGSLGWLLFGILILAGSKIIWRPQNTPGENSRVRAHHQVRLAAESCCGAAFSARIGVNGGLRAPIEPLMETIAVLRLASFRPTSSVAKLSASSPAI